MRSGDGVKEGNEDDIRETLPNEEFGRGEREYERVGVKKASGVDYMLCSTVFETIRRDQRL